jgi:hypothetical protein
MDSERRVALLSLLYRTCHVNRHSNAQSIEDDFGSCPGEVSLATLEASRSFTWKDWRIVALLDQPEHVLAAARTLATDGDPARAEALMHALPPHGRYSWKPWAEQYSGKRWRAVECAMRELEAEGITASRDDVESVAVYAYRALTGGTHEDYMDEYADSLFRERV